MAEFNHLSKEKMEHVVTGLWEISSALKGLGAVFQSGQNEIPLDGDEWFGIGQILNVVSQKSSSLEDILRCGYDSTAIRESVADTDLDKVKSKLSECIKTAVKDLKGEDED